MRMRTNLQTAVLLIQLYIIVLTHYPFKSEKNKPSQNYIITTIYYVC